MFSRDQLRKLNSSPIVFGGLIAGAAIGKALPVGSLAGALVGAILATIVVLVKLKRSSATDEESGGQEGQ